MDDSNEANDDSLELDGFIFDEGFVKAAGVRELSASDRLRTLERQRIEVAEGKRRLRDERAAKRFHRQLGQWLHLRLRQYVGVTVVLALLVTAVWWDFRNPRQPSTAWGGSDSVAGKRVGSDMPTPTPPQSTHPLGVVPEVAQTSSPYRFLNKQVGSDEPVTYDPCRTISVVINDSKAPRGSEGTVNEALEEMSRLTGLQFRIEGRTDEVYASQRSPFQPDRYGDRWAPVLIVWSDESSVADLAGDVVGRGGSDVLTLESKHEVYVSGQVGLDATDAADILRHDKGRAEVKAIVLHELAHLVGLDHVFDGTQLMNPEGSEAVLDVAAGDRAGLARLGKGACNPML